MRGPSDKPPLLLCRPRGISGEFFNLAGGVWYLQALQCGNDRAARPELLAKKAMRVATVAFGTFNFFSEQLDQRPWSCHRLGVRSTHQTCRIWGHDASLESWLHKKVSLSSAFQKEMSSWRYACVAPTNPLASSDGVVHKYTAWQEGHDESQSLRSMPFAWLCPNHLVFLEMLSPKKHGSTDHRPFISER
jgi:hypothetical protein